MWVYDDRLSIRYLSASMVDDGFGNLIEHPDIDSYINARDFNHTWIELH